MPPNDPFINQALYENVIEALQEAKSGISNLSSKVHANDVQLAQLNINMINAQKDLSEVIKILRGEGNDNNSVVNRLSSVENKVNLVDSRVTNISKTLTDSQTASTTAAATVAAEKVKSNATVKVAVIAAIASVCGGLFTVFGVLLPLLFR